MGKLILIRHAHPQIDQGQSSRVWSLSPAGRDGARRAAEALTGAGICRIFTSEETKAIQTGQVIADCLGIEAETAPDLHEHDRTGVGFLDQAAFARAISGLFTRRAEVVFGRESGDAAADRLLAAIAEINARVPDADASLACVTHGTVMALVASRLNGRDGHALWKGLGLPSTITLDWDTQAVLEIVNEY
jgi:broad specificity phosphatase PhoE